MVMAYKLPALPEAIQPEEDGWMRDAACPSVDPELFFPFPHGSGLQVRAAKAVCKQCPVTAECLAFALRHVVPFGIWGGKTETERREELKRRDRRPIIESNRSAIA